MKYFYLLLFFLISCVTNAQVRTLNAESVITSVTIFKSGAQVLRNASVGLQPGRTSVVFTGLSNQLEQKTVQLKANANITLLSVKAVRDYLGQRKIDQNIQAYRSRLDEAKEKLELDQNMLQVYKREEAMLTANEAIGGQAGVKTEELKQALDLHRSRLTEVYQKQQELTKRIAASQKEVASVSTQMAEISRKKDSITYTVIALMETKLAAEVKFQLSYTVSDAGWNTNYDVRVGEVNKPFELMMNANVHQSSGETWKDVQVKLSTGNPADNKTQSQLLPWRLGFYDPSVYRFRNENTPGVVSGRVVNEHGAPIPGVSITQAGTRMGTMSDEDGYFSLRTNLSECTLQISAVGYESKSIVARSGYYGITLALAASAMNEVVVTGYNNSGYDDREVKSYSNAKKKADVQAVAVSTEYQPTNTLYTIEEKYTIETDGKSITIPIKKVEVPAVYEYFTAPKIDASVFLSARVVNWQDYDLQSGEAQLYFDGSFLGTTYIDLAQATDTLTLSLGKDNGIAVSRKLLKEFSAKKLIGANRTETKEYEITVRNNRHTAVNITVQDQFPLSANKEISVQDQSAEGATVDKETGIVLWQIALEPGQEKKLKLSYDVKYPKDKKIVLE